MSLTWTIWKVAKYVGQWEETGLWNKKLQPILSRQAYEKQGSWANSLFWIADPSFTGMSDSWIQPRWAAMFEDLYSYPFRRCTVNAK